MCVRGAGRDSGLVSLDGFIVEFRSGCLND